MNLIKKKNLALVLSGGSARGFAHIGVLQVLEENHVPIDSIIGTSIGALVGGLYAAGKLNQFTEKAISLSKNRILTLFLERKMKRGNTNTRTIEPFLREFTAGKKIQDLVIAFTAIATDLRTGKETFINKGDLMEAILASISIPGIFQPVKMGNKLLVDGGVVDPLPQHYGHVIAKKVIAINAMPCEFKYKEESDVFDIISESIGIMTHELITLKQDHNKNSVFIQLKTEKINSIDFSKISTCIKIGRRAAEKNINKIKELVLS